MEKKEDKPIVRDLRSLQRELRNLSGRDIMARILDHENPMELVRGLPSEDFYWMIKKVGEEDCLPLLQLASDEQWQYVLDLEIWIKDRLDIKTTSQWLKRLQEADCRRLVRWLTSEGEFLAFTYFFRTLDVIIAGDKDEVYDIPEGYFTLDGEIYQRVRLQEFRDSLETILRTLAATDLERYQALLIGLSGVLPAETEEEMYRRRNVRLAEHGFLPYEEAVSLYAPLEPERLVPESSQAHPEVPEPEEEIGALVPLSPFQHAGGENIFLTAAGGVQDPVFLDRLTLEFAGLCNQLVSADSLLVRDIDVLVKTCRKAAGYVNLALEKLCGKDLRKAREVLKNHSLVALFRVGFGLALKLKWEAERWFKGSWFIRQGLDLPFWGEPWSGILKGLLARRPEYYTVDGGEEEYRGFEWLSELGESMAALRHMMVLDGLLERLSERHPIEGYILKSPEFTFHPLLFNLWGRSILGLTPSFAGMTLKQVKALFGELRDSKAAPPYTMEEGGKRFIEYFMAYATDSPPDVRLLLREALAWVWKEFQEEYAWVSLGDLDGRFLRHIKVVPESERVKE
ncbi:MAG: hypothetical protein JRH13_09465 [Deltaproteobacteria bacterium]|nr:hypothetical protein [Deltaproteobacteria bacterium]